MYVSNTGITSLLWLCINKIPADTEVISISLGLGNVSRCSSLAIFFYSCLLHVIKGKFIQVRIDRRLTKFYPVC